MFIRLDKMEGMAKKLSTTTTAPKAPSPLAGAPKHRRPRTSPPPSAPVHTITNDDIATLAFSYWERRGYQGGNPQEDWTRAEEELNSLLRDPK